MDFINYSSSPSELICPRIRIQNVKDQFSKPELDNYRIMDNSYYLSDAKEDEYYSCFHHLNLLFWCNNKEDNENDFSCGACWQRTIGTTYYSCNICYHSYHKECVESPSVLISPYHPKYHLQLIQFFSASECHSCGKQIKDLAYYSSICDLLLHPVCATKQKFTTINNQKRHEHTLHYFPRKTSIICDVCGTDDNKICFYICHQCNFVVHLTCVNLPHVIQISRHIHRLHFTSSLPSGIWSCGVCRQNIDENYGEYSCAKGCAYAVHSKCVIIFDVWDGKELEDEPETIYDNIKSYEEIGDGIIQHFSHPHHNMRFDNDIDKEYYEKQCEACLLFLYDGNIYRCDQCDFVLHESCVNLPRIKQIMVHAHYFILEPNNSKSHFFCESCCRYFSGFRYTCVERCYSLDVSCASLSEPVHHQSHPHPLFQIYTRRDEKLCFICGELFHLLLNCVTCVFALCFRCASLPCKIKHKGDKHFLFLSYEKDAFYPFWCQLCEEKIDPKKGYYQYSEYETTFHIECIVGNDQHLKPGPLNIFSGNTIDIISNNRLTRPICNHCQIRCQSKLIFIRHGKIFCSYFEIFRLLEEERLESLKEKRRLEKHKWKTNKY